MPTSTTTNDGQTPLASLMLSKLLQHARNILAPQTSTSTTDPEEEIKSITRTMVTTRRQSGNNSDPTTDVHPAFASLTQDIHSGGSRKRRQHPVADEATSRTALDDSSPAITRKRQKLPMREKDEQPFEKHTHFAVEIPVRVILRDGTPMWTAPKQGKSKGKRVLPEDISSGPDIHGKDNQKNDNPEENQASDPVAQVVVGDITSSQDKFEKAVAEGERRERVGSKSKRKENSGPVPVQAASTSNTIHPKHKRFDSEEPAAEELALVIKEGDNLEEEDENSDDDTPELVATHDAQERVTVTARSAARAVEKQEAVIRNKRKERDAQLKEQAEAAKKKRKRAEGVDEGHATSTSLDATTSLDAENRGDSSEKALDSSNQNDFSQSQNIITKHNIPEFLPVEYFEDDPIEDHSSVPSIKQMMIFKSKKIKFMDPTPKKSKDRRKGSTIYRVTEAPGSSLLAPKAASNARSVKEAWLNGRRGSGRSMKVVKGGFFKNRK